MKTWCCVALAMTMAGGSAHAQLAASANDNKIVLVNGVPTVVQRPQPDTVALIDLRARPPAVLRHVEVKASVVGPPLSVAITPDESLLLVTSAMKLDPADPSRLVPDDKLSVVALTSDPPALLAELEAGAGAAGLSITRDGRLALVANRNEGTVSVFRIQGTSVRKIDTVVVARPEAGVAHVAIAPDGRTALVTRDGDHTISLLSIAADKVTYAGRDFGTGLKPYGAVITQDGRFAVVANLGLGRGDNDTVSLVDLALRPPRVVETYTVGQTPEGIAISPDGRLVAVVTMNGSNKPADSPFHSAVGRVVLLRVLRDRLQIVSDAPIGPWPQGAAFSADGATLLVQSMSERNIMVFAIDNGTTLRDTGQRIALRGGGAALRVADSPPH
jgi:DNA-binding beta-propeller fold protein YncE